jgi:hypothetical protein
MRRFGLPRTLPGRIGQRAVIHEIVDSNFVDDAAFRGGRRTPPTRLSFVSASCIFARSRSTAWCAAGTRATR